MDGRLFVVARAPEEALQTDGFPELIGRHVTERLRLDREEPECLVMNEVPAFARRAGGIVQTAPIVEPPDHWRACVGIDGPRRFFDAYDRIEPAGRTFDGRRVPTYDELVADENEGSSLAGAVLAKWRGVDLEAWRRVSEVVEVIANEFNLAAQYVRYVLRSRGLPVPDFDRSPTRHRWSGEADKTLAAGDPIKVDPEPSGSYHLVFGEQVDNPSAPWAVFRRTLNRSERVLLGETAELPADLLDRFPGLRVDGLEAWTPEQNAAAVAEDPALRADFTTSQAEAE